MKRQNIKLLSLTAVITALSLTLTGCFISEKNIYDIVDAVQLLKQLEVGDRLGQGGHGSGEHHGFGVTALAGQHRHGADGLEHQIHHAGRQIGGGHILAAAGRQTGVKVKVIVIFHAEHLSGTMLRHRVCRPFAPNGASSVFADSENLAEGAIHLPRGSERTGPPPGGAGWGDRQECRWRS